MKQKQDILHSLIIEVTMVLLASMVAFQVCNMLGIRMSLIPLVMVIGYVIQKLLYHLCIITAGDVVDALTPSFLISVKKCVSKKAQSLAYSPTSNCEEVQKKRMELFHYEYQREQQQYQWQKEREEDEKLQAVLQYTRNTFRQFDFSEEEIFQICECVRYFVTNRKALSVNIHIKRRTAVTQISLKNFAWNIAFQYNISRDVTAQFVIQTFHEWFANSTLDTIRKNLRTTTGNHKIKIDEQIIKHPIISN